MSFKIQLKALAEDTQIITKGLDIVIQEKKMCKKDGHPSKRFRKVHEIIIISIYFISYHNVSTSFTLYMEM